MNISSSGERGEKKVYYDYLRNRPELGIRSTTEGSTYTLRGRQTRQGLGEYAERFEMVILTEEQIINPSK